MELGRRRRRVRHVHRGRGLPRRRGGRARRRQHLQVAARHGNHLRVEPVLDQARPAVHVLPHLPVPPVQEAGRGRGRLRRALGRVRILSLHLHLRARREAVAADRRGPLRQRAGRVAGQRELNHLLRRCHLAAAHPAGLEAAAQDAGKGWPDAGIWPGLLVSFLFLHPKT